MDIHITYDFGSAFVKCASHQIPSDFIFHLDLNLCRNDDIVFYGISQSKEFLYSLNNYDELPQHAGYVLSHNIETQKTPKLI